MTLYQARGAATPFALYADTYRDQCARGAALNLNPLVASYGPALLDRAILDALGRILGLSFADLIRANVPGIGVTELTPDLRGLRSAAFSCKPCGPAAAIDVRHTVGLVDPITAGDQAPGQRVNDGLPETLEEVARHYGCRYYKLKVGGDVAADIDRLTRIAVGARPRGWRLSCHPRRQRAVRQRRGDRRALAPHGRDAGAEAAGRRDPVHRAADQARGGAEPARRDTRARASADHRRVGRRAGVVPGGARSSAMPASQARTAKDSTNRCSTQRAWPSSTQRPGARVTSCRERTLRHGPASACSRISPWFRCSGLTHVERNGHHFIDGMCFAPEHEQRAFVEAHSDLYAKKEGPARLRIANGQLQLGRSGAPASPSPQTWILPRCGPCRQRQRPPSIQSTRRRWLEVPFPLRQRLGHLAGSVDEQLCRWTER